MPASARIIIDQHGRVTIPASARRALRLDGGSQLECEVEEDRIVLRRASIPDEDAWAYTPEVRESLGRAQADARAGRTYLVSTEFLEAVLAAAAVADREGRELTRDDALAMLEAGAQAGTVEKVDGAGE